MLSVSCISATFAIHFERSKIMQKKSIETVISRLIEVAIEQIQEGYPEKSEATLEDALEFLKTTATE
jgi:hypothetical protein